MYTSDFKEFMKIFESISDRMPDLLMYISEVGDTQDGTREQIFMQKLVRNDRDYFALRNIHLNHANRSKGIFTKIIEHLEHMSFPVMVDDIINPKVKAILASRKWMEFHYYKNGGKNIAMVYKKK